MIASSLRAEGRGGGEQENGFGGRGEGFDEGVGRAGFVRMPLEMMGFIDNQEVEAGVLGLPGPARVFSEELSGTEDELTV